MSNLNNNRINTTMTEVEVENVKDALITVLKNMKFLIGLTTQERQSIPKINVSNKAFVEDAINAGANNPDMLPGYMSMAPMHADLQLFHQLDEILVLSRQLTEKLEDTQKLAGSEAYISALTLYRLFEAAAKAGIPGADALYSALRQRFVDQGGAGLQDVPPTS